MRASISTQGLLIAKYETIYAIIADIISVGLSHFYYFYYYSLFGEDQPFQPAGSLGARPWRVKRQSQTSSGTDLSPNDIRDQTVLSSQIQPVLFPLHLGHNKLQSGTTLLLARFLR